MPYFEDGTSRIYYEDEGDGAPVLLLHGWGGSMHEVRSVRAALTPEFRVIAVDTPGCGKSEPQPREFPATYLEDDAASFLALLEHLQLPPTHLVGFSDGGEYSLVMGATKPDAVRSIVTWGSAGQLPDTPGSLDTFDTLIDDPIEPLKSYSKYLRDTYGVEGARLMVQSSTDAWKGVIARGGGIARPRAAEIACPALLIVGEKDFLCPPPLVIDMVSAMPNAEYAEVRDSAHSVHNEQPEVFLGLLKDWLRAH